MQNARTINIRIIWHNLFKFCQQPIAGSWSNPLVNDVTFHFLHCFTATPYYLSFTNFYLDLLKSYICDVYLVIYFAEKLK